MSNSPIVAIENAELEAQQLVLKANSDKLKIIQQAAEKAHEDFIAAVRKAEADSEKLLKKTQQELQNKTLSENSDIENKKKHVKDAANKNKDAAIKAIFEIVSRS